jgi:glycosyltransferase involved in cell wall biosynthesis
MTRVLHVIGSSKFGGATLVVFSLVDMARQHGLEAEVLTDDPTTVLACGEQGIRVFRFRGIDRPIRPLKDLRAKNRLARALAERRDTIVHTHTFKGGLLGRWAAHAAGVPVIVHHNHGMSFQETSGRLRRAVIARVERFAAARCDHIISVNRADIEWAVDAGVAPREKFTFVPNGVARQRIEAVRAVGRDELTRTLGIPSDSALVTVVARLVSEKGYPDLFAALAEVPSVDGRPVHLVALGDGPEREVLLKQAGRLGVAGRVHFLGYRADALCWAKACDVFALPSLREGHSVTVIEAMGLALPIVATDIRGIRDSVRDGREGLLVPPRDAAALAAALRQVLGNPAEAEQMADAARERFRLEYTEDRMKERVWAVYEAVAREKGIDLVPAGGG